jgi:hypothetical protein
LAAVSKPSEEGIDRAASRAFHLLDTAKCAAVAAVAVFKE